MFGLTKLPRVTIGPRTRYELRSNMSADTFFAKLAALPRPFAFGLLPFGFRTRPRVKLGTNRFAVYTSGFSQYGRLIGEAQSGPAPLRITLIADLRCHAKYLILLSNVFGILILILLVILAIEKFVFNITSFSILPIAIFFIMWLAIAIGQQSMAVAMARNDHDRLLKFLASVSDGEIRPIEAEQPQNQ